MYYPSICSERLKKTMKISVSIVGVMNPCSPVDGTYVSEKSCAYILNSEDGGTMFLRNIGAHLPGYTVSYLRIQYEFLPSSDFCSYRFLYISSFNCILFLRSFAFHSYTSVILSSFLPFVPLPSSLLFNSFNLSNLSINPEFPSCLLGCNTA